MSRENASCNPDTHTDYGDRQAEKGWQMVKTVGATIGLGVLAIGAVKGCESIEQNSQYNTDQCNELRDAARHNGADPNDPTLSFTAENGAIVYCNQRSM